MDYVNSFTDWACNNYVMVVGFSILILLFTKDYLECRMGSSVDQNTFLSTYHYGGCQGPHTWKDKYLPAGGNRQSPINIVSNAALNIPCETIAPLIYSKDYHMSPYEMTLHNNGYNAVIYANWPNNMRPAITGGPLLDEYNFFNITFRWGPVDDEGSEHMVDAKRYAMEMQIAYIKNETQSLTTNILQAAQMEALLIVSYFFMVTPVENPYIEPIVAALPYIRDPCNATHIEPIPITLLAPCFERQYISYVGSLTYPPCIENVRWIIQPEPLTISARQVRKFRKLNGINGTIVNNTRPVQNVNNREIYYYD